MTARDLPVRPISDKLPRLSRLTSALLGGVLSIASFAALAFQPFTIRDIRVEGVQRTEAGTVFSYLPVKVGEVMDDDKAARAIKALYATGFYTDVRWEVENDVLVVFVAERPAIAQIEIEGAKEFSKDNLKDGLKTAGISEAKIFDRSVLDRAEKEIKRQYTSRGFYSSKVTTTVTPLERNRVSLKFGIEEGEPSKIVDINIIGAKAFKESTLLKEFEQTTSGWFTFFTKDDQYSKQKLSGDLEKLRSYYLNRGYLDFNIESTQVSITPEKDKIYITIVISEGEVYKLTDSKFQGDLKITEAEMRSLLLMKPGEIFSRQKVVDSVKQITDRLGNDGYSFANINPVPDRDPVAKTASFTFFVDPGKRVYVRRINIVGNSRTRDEVIRREIRQLERYLREQRSYQRLVDQYKSLLLQANARVQIESEKNEHISTGVYILLGVACTILVGMLTGAGMFAYQRYQRHKNRVLLSPPGPKALATTSTGEYPQILHILS